MRPHPRAMPLAAGLLLAGLLAACTGSSTPTPLPTASPSTSAVAVIVTFKAGDGSTWKMRLVRAADIGIARDLLAGRPGPRIPNGRIVRDSPEVNTGWSWHLDPTDFEWADMTTEVCDGNPKNVEDGTLTSDRYCPWSAAVIAVDPAP